MTKASDEAITELTGRLTIVERHVLQGVCNGQQPEPGKYEGALATLVNAFLLQFQFAADAYVPTKLGEAVAAGAGVATKADAA